MKMRFAAVLLAFPAAASAGDHVFTADNPQWKGECGSCHIAYPPQLLPAESWRALMAGLDRHFGVDASVDKAASAEIGAFLERNARKAGRAVRQAGSPPLRITETAWFQREHDELAATTWNLPAVRSPANCGACHTRAESGDFAERSLRVPR